MNLFDSKIDKLLFLYIAVDRFLKRILLLDRFLKHALIFDRFFIIFFFGRIELACYFKPTIRKKVLSHIP